MDESGKNPIEEIAFQMVTAVNDARVNYLKAVHAARNRDFAVAQQYIEAGDDRYSAGHGAHTRLLQMETAGTFDRVNLLLMHAEDQLISAESYKMLAVESIHIYRAIQHRD